MAAINEVVGIGACVAEVISAYHDGDAIIQKIKARRAARRAPAPPRLLEESIDQAPEEIEREKQRGVRRFGRAFEDGDELASTALQHIASELQDGLVTKLRVAVAVDDDATDLTYLVDVADRGRDRTIAALLELRQRLLECHPIGDGERQAAESGAQSAPPTAPPAGSSLPKPASESSSLLSPAPAPARHSRTWTRDYGGSRERPGGDDDDDAASGVDSRSRQPHGRRHSSLRNFLGRHYRSHSGSPDHVPKGGEGIRHSASVTSVPLQLTPVSDVPSQPSSPGSQGQLYRNPFETPRLSGNVSQEGQRRDTVVAVGLAPHDPPSPSRSSINLPTRTISNTRSTLPSRRSSSSRTPTATSFTATPTPENDYLGFCKSAWRLQNGDRAKAFNRCKEPNDVWTETTVYFLACSSKCAFAAHLDLTHIWSKLYTYSTRGVKLRWPFLAKSHVPQHVVTNHQYVYQCMFCVFRGESRSVYSGTDALVGHIAQQHRGETLGDVILYKTKCIADYVADDSEEFDINLFPLSAEEQAERNESLFLSDEMLSGGGRVTRTAAEAKQTSEPWNEGLSDFHWVCEVERTELE